MVNRFWHHHFIVVTVLLSSLVWASFWVCGSASDWHPTSFAACKDVLGHEELQAGLAAAARPIDVGIYSVWSSCRPAAVSMTISCFDFLSFR